MNFASLVQMIREERNASAAVPGFDPSNGNEQARFLLLLEAPGPKAIETGLVSLDNPDPSARNLKAQLAAAEIQRRDLAIWNVVPWFIGDFGERVIRPAKRSDVREGIRYLPPLLDAMPNLQGIVLIGAVARSTHIFLSHTTSARILACHHPSARVMNANPGAFEENVAVFRNLSTGGLSVTAGSCGE